MGDQNIGDWISGDRDGDMPTGMEMMRQLEALMKRRQLEEPERSLKDVAGLVFQEMLWHTLVPFARKNSLGTAEVRSPARCPS